MIRRFRADEDIPRSPAMALQRAEKVNRGNTKRPGRILQIIGLYGILGLLYSLVVPLFEAPDEFAHMAYAAHLAQGKGLPVLRRGAVEARRSPAPALLWSPCRDRSTERGFPGGPASLISTASHSQRGSPTRGGEESRFPSARGNPRSKPHCGCPSDLADDLRRAGSADHLGSLADGTPLVLLVSPRRPSRSLDRHAPRLPLRKQLDQQRQYGEHNRGCWPLVDREDLALRRLYLTSDHPWRFDGSRCSEQSQRVAPLADRHARAPPRLVEPTIPPNRPGAYRACSDHRLELERKLVLSKHRFIWNPPPIAFTGNESGSAVGYPNLAARASFPMVVRSCQDLGAFPRDVLGSLRAYGEHSHA